jgi:uncharacterized membrane protein YbhN (UPF0104 family)
VNRLREFLQSRTGRWLGTLISIICVAVFLVLLARSFSSDQARILVAGHGRSLILALGLYGLAYLPMVAAWIMLAETAGCRHGARRELARIFLVSQVGKYLPGNVGQFIGRAYAGERRNFRLAALSKAMVLELGAVLAASALLAAAAFALGAVSPTGAGDLSWPFSIALALATCVALAGAAMAFRTKDVQRLVLRSSLAAVGCYAMVLILAAAANVVLVSASLSHWTWPLVFAVGGAFVVSWLAGFVTPGAPAGLGVRELAFCSLLAGVVPGELLILSAAGFRLVTTAGDLIAWIVGLSIRRPSQTPQAIELTA